MNSPQGQGQASAPAAVKPSNDDKGGEDDATFTEFLASLMDYTPTCHSMSSKLVNCSCGYEIKVMEQQERLRNQRKMQVGTGARTEKISTYNYKRSRYHILTCFLNGDIESAVQACASMEQKELLEELTDSVGATAAAS